MQTSMRKYEETHPWLRFELDLRRVGPDFWALLGEACSKCLHLAGVPLRPATAARLHQLFLAKGVLATTAIEGNTLSEEEVICHLEGKLRLPPSKQYLGQEIGNIVEACNGILREVRGGSPYPLTPDRLCVFNRQVLEKLPIPAEVIPGRPREHAVGVGRYRCPPAADVPFLLDRLCDWLHGRFLPESFPHAPLADAVIQAIVAHLYVAWIHPFGDGNGRTARLAEFAILVAAGVPSPAAHLLSNHYNLTRAEYYRQLDASSRGAGEPHDFLVYALRGFVDGLQAQVDEIRRQQMDVAWRSYVYERFSNVKGRHKERWRHVALDLTRKPPTPIEQIPNLSPRLAAAYARLSRKTLLRDLAALEAEGLIRGEGAGYVACPEVIESFLPWSALPPSVQSRLRGGG